MDAFTKQSRETQVVIGGSALFVILSFFNWQSFKVEFLGNTIGGSWSLWHGLGVIAALLAIALLIWEVVRLTQSSLEVGGVSPGFISAVLAALLVVVTVIKFLQANEGRAWPAWVGLIVAIAVGVAAWLRAQAEDVRMPDFSSRSSTATNTATAADAPPPPAAASTSAPPAGGPPSQDPPGV